MRITIFLYKNIPSLTFLGFSDVYNIPGELLKFQRVLVLFQLFNLVRTLNNCSQSLHVCSRSLLTINEDQLKTYLDRFFGKRGLHCFPLARISDLCLRSGDIELAIDLFLKLYRFNINKVSFKTKSTKSLLLTIYVDLFCIIWVVSALLLNSVLFNSM